MGFLIRVEPPKPSSLLPVNPKPSLRGGSWVAISRAISPLIGVINIVILLITPLTTTHEPPSKVMPNSRNTWEMIYTRWPQGKGFFGTQTLREHFGTLGHAGFPDTPKSLN